MECDNTKNIMLFIDDEKVCHSLIELIVPNFTKLRLISAFNGHEAFELFDRYADKICIVLSDIILPDTTGYEIFLTLRKQSNFSDAKFIFQTGLTSQEKKLCQNITEEVRVLCKPYTQKELLHYINLALGPKKSI